MWGGPTFRTGAPPPAGRRSTGFLLRVTEKSKKGVSIEIPINEFAFVFDGTAVQVMLSGRRRIISAGDVAIKDPSRVVYVCVRITVGDMVRRLDVAKVIKRSAIALAI